MASYDEIPVSVLIGKTLLRVAADKHLDEIIFHTDDGETYKLYHEQNCCENVSIESIVGDINDLIGSPILMAEESTIDKNPPYIKEIEYQDSFTWTFYKFATIKGYVTIRWYGSSNGYYSEEVNFKKIEE